jgi:glutamine synthetase type III
MSDTVEKFGDRVRAGLAPGAHLDTKVEQMLEAVTNMSRAMLKAIKDLKEATTEATEKEQALKKAKELVTKELVEIRQLRKQNEVEPPVQQMPVSQKSCPITRISLTGF